MADSAGESMSVDSNQAEPRPPLRHASLYFEDGDLVLSSTREDGGIVFFRVHTAILRQFSPVFHDMLSVPEGPSGRGTHDGAPLVHLHDDPGALSEFIDALYNPGCALVLTSIFRTSD